MINRSGSRGDDLRLSKIRSILPKKEKRETRLKSFLYGTPPPSPARKILDQSLVKRKRTKKRKGKQTIGLLITLTCNQLADAITFYGVVLIVTVAFLAMFFLPNRDSHNSFPNPQSITQKPLCLSSILVPSVYNVI